IDRTARAAVIMRLFSFQPWIRRERRRPFHQYRNQAGSPGKPGRVAEPDHLRAGPPHRPAGSHGRQAGRTPAHPARRRTGSGERKAAALLSGFFLILVGLVWAFPIAFGICWFLPET